MEGSCIWLSSKDVESMDDLATCLKQVEYIRTINYMGPEENTGSAVAIGEFIYDEG